MRKFKVMILSSVICFLSSVICFLPSAYAGVAVSVTGGNWAIGNIRSSNVATSTAGTWTVTNDGTVPANIFIKADGTNWHPGTTQGANTFVLTYQASGSSGWSSAITNTATGIWLRLLGYSTTANKTMSFGLRFAAPTSGSTATTDTMTVTLTAQYFPALTGGQWRIINNEIICEGATVKIGTVTGPGYLMWPRQQSCGATNNNVGKQWKKTAAIVNHPTWNDVDSYTYPGGAGETIADYPAFEWVEAVDYAGFVDWRLPTKDELEDLYDTGRSYISYTSDFYWSATEYNASNAYVVSFYNGAVHDYSKANTYYVRAVRSGQW